MQWVLDFAELEVNTLSGGDWLNRQFELEAFQLFGYEFTKQLVATTARGRYPLGAYLTYNSKEEAISFQGKVRNHLHRFVSTGHTAMSLEGLKLDVYGVSGGGNHLLSGESAFEFQIVWLLASNETKVRQCAAADCPRRSRIYLAERPRQQYCSSRCRSRIAMRQLRKSVKKSARLKRQSKKQGG